MHPAAVRSTQNLHMSQDDATPGGFGLETAIQKRLANIDSGNYERSSRVALEFFAEWAASQPDISGLDDITRTHLFRFVEDDAGLRGRVDSGQIAPRTAHAYYRYIRAAFSWWQKMGYIPENPALDQDVVDELPEVTDDPERQFWSKRHVDAMTAHVNLRVDEALDDGDDRAALLAARDRVLFLLLAYSGARGAELFRDPDDEKRNGIRFRDIDADRGAIRVLGKNRTQQDALLSARIEGPLSRYGTLYEPASESWPVIPSLDHATLHTRIRDVLRGRGWDDTSVEAALENTGPLAVCREHDIAPGALSVRSARSVMRRLCSAAEIDIDGEYLKPHGGRRGLGNRLYEEQAELAQETLRHQSIETTHRAYREQQSEKRREKVDDVLNEADIPDSYNPDA